MTIKRPTKPPAPPSREAVTPIEHWYYQCLATLTAHLGRPPTLVELANYTKKSVTALYRGLLRLESKGHVRREKKSRRFGIVGAGS